MELKELRLGNYYECDGEYYKVYLTTFKDVEFEDVEFDGEPIELTEDILLKCGFKLVDGVNRGYSICLNEALKKYLYSNPKYGTLALYDDFLKFTDIIIDRECKALHTLQNLYFALTNTELTIEL